MFRTHQSSQPAFRSILTRHENLKARTDTGVFYIGLGDQFDDGDLSARQRPHCAQRYVLLDISG